MSLKRPEKWEKLKASVESGKMRQRKTITTRRERSKVSHAAKKTCQKKTKNDSSNLGIWWSWLT